MKNIRNFSIIAHIDAGKSTLADRFLEITGTVEKRKLQEQHLDQMELEREKGITIKLQPVRMEYRGFILNLIDTPGHMDFYLEVKRSLSAVEGAILLIDGTQGIQAQTLANWELAKELGLKIILVVNKIDILESIPDYPFKISAKTGEGVKELLDAIIKEIPPPTSKKTIIFDSVYDEYHGIINYIRSGKRIKGRVGVFKPEMASVKELLPGEIGYQIIGKKEIKPIFRAQPLIFANLFADGLRTALAKLQLNDQGLSIEPVDNGWHCGFLGILHMEIVLERLKREFGIEPMITAPQVEIKQGKEPWVELEIITPKEYVHKIINLLKVKCQEIKNLNENRLVLVYHVPLYEVIKNLVNQLKNISQGFASMSYKFLDWRPSKLKKLDILINKEKIEALSRYIREEREAGKIVKRLKQIIPRQQFALPIQAVINNKIIARETLPALRKDVIAGLYGGDYTRKKKLLEKQKKGKKKLAKYAKVNLPIDKICKQIYNV